MQRLIFYGMVLMGLCRCGLPDTNSLGELNRPTDIKLENCEINNNLLTIHLSYYAYNKEANFSGYDVYLDDSVVTLEESKNTIQGIVDDHINTQTFLFDDEIESEYIISNNDKRYPTILVNEGSTEFLNGPERRDFSFSKMPDNGPIPKQGSFLSIGMTAISMSDIKESIVSNIILISVNESRTPICTSLE